MATITIGMKLGSNVSWIYKADSGMVLYEPTMIAISTSLKNKEVKAVGYDAKQLVGRAPENVSLFSPISNGIIQYEELTALLIKEFLNKIFIIKKFNQKIKVILFVPECLNYDEKKQYEVCCYKAGINEVVLLPEILCYDVGMSSPEHDNHANLYVNLGYDQTTISIVSHNSIVNAYSLSVGSSIINIEIKKYIEDKYFIKIGATQDNFIREEICSLFENYNASLNINGFNTKTQTKQQVTITANEFYPILSYYYGKIVESIKSILLSSDPVIASDVMMNGIIFLGGASDIAGLELFTMRTIGYISTNINDKEYEKKGIEKILNSPALLKRLA